MNTFLTELFLAWRYFKPKRNATSVITVISVVGVSLGVCVLMVVLAIMTGFTHEIKTKLLDVTPHIQIESKYKSYIADPDSVVKKLKSDKSIVSIVERTEGEALIQKGDEVIPQFVVGINEDKAFKDQYLKGKLVSGRYSLKSGEAMISYILSNRLGIRPGDKIVIHSPSKLKKMVKFTKDGKVERNDSGEVYLPTELKVSGIFNIGMYDFDKNMLITNLDDADDLFGYPWDSATKVSIKVKDPFDIDGIYYHLRNELPDYKVTNWKQLNSQFLDVLSVEKNMMFFVLIFIVLVAASSITNTLITVVVQKTREIGVLRSLGASPSSIMRVFIFQGFFVGFLGTGLGILLGWIVIIFRMEILKILSTCFHIEIFPKQFYYLSSLPAQIVGSDILFIAITTILLCTAGALIPAFRASRLDPAKALRYE